MVSMTGYCLSTVLTCILVSGVEPAAEAANLFSKPPTWQDVSHAMVFEEPLVPIGKPTAKETGALAKALDAYVTAGKLEDLGPVEDFLRTHPASHWRLTLLVNAGLVHRHVGRVTQALRMWEAAWELGKGFQDPQGKALTHRALGELLETSAGLGRQDQLERWIQAAEGRDLSGPVTEKLSSAKESLVYMKFGPDEAFRCGPTALAYLKAAEAPMAFVDPRLDTMRSSEQGTQLAMNLRWAEDFGLKLQMAQRISGFVVPVPSVLHFRTGHFAAAMAARDGRILVQDPFLGDTWMPLAVLRDEMSGSALVPAGALPEGWVPLAQDQGAAIWGKGAWGPGRPDDTRPDSVRIRSGLSPEAPGLPVLAFHPNLVSLNLEIPASSYAPARGPRVAVTVTYNQREYGQPQLFDYCNLGSKWTFSFLACLKDDSTNPNVDVTLCNPGGGGLVFQTRGDGTFLPENYTQAQLLRQPGNTYVIHYLDGHKDFYELADRAWGLRRIVLTRRQDSAGNEARFTWDAMLRLASITDATGRVTKLSYDLPTDPLKLTQVTDPSGRSTQFQYDAQGHLSKTISPTGASATFAYGPTAKDPALPADFVNGMTWPTGTLAFRAGETLIGPSYRRWLEVANAAGQTERVEGGAGYAYEIDPEQLPRVPEIDPEQHPFQLSSRESFYWAPGSYDPGKPNFRKARHLRWGHGPGGFSSGIVLSEMAPGGTRHWFVHAGDFWGGPCYAARSERSPLTPDGILKPGAKLRGVTGTTAMSGSLAPVCDGNRNLVTRDYWQEADGTLHGRKRDFDLQGRLLREAPVTP